MADANPLPIIAFPQAAGAMAWAMSLPERLAVQVGAAPGLKLKSLSRLSCSLFVAPPGFELPGLV